MGIRVTALIIGLIAAGLVWAGCGGSSDSSSEVTASSISKGQFIKEADAACKEAEERIQKDFKTFTSENKNLANPTEDQFSELIETVLVANIEQELEDIRALGAPSGDEEKVEAILAARTEGTEEAEAQPKLAVQGTLPGFEKADKLATEYGFKTCATR